jgi:hypothetical protein
MVRSEAIMPHNSGGMEMVEIHNRKVIVSRDEVAAFNSKWPCSELRPTRAYWFEFDDNQDLIDVDVPEQDDGSAATAMAEDCKSLLFDGEEAEWMDVKA